MNRTFYRITSGHVFQLVSGTGTAAYNTVNNLTDSGVVLNGITVNQLQSMFNQMSSSPNRSLYYVNPQLVGSDGRANPKYVSPATTPGQFGSFVYLYGPRIFSADMALTKDLPLTEHLKFRFQAEALNVFNHPVFGALPAGTTALSITDTSFGQTTTQVINPRSLQLRAYLQW